MRELVREDVRVLALARVALLIGTDQRQRLAHRDDAGVLHRPPEPRHDGDIELAVRVVHVEVVLERRDDLRRDLFRVAELTGAALRDDEVDRRLHATGGAVVDVLERPDHERDEVARQRLARRELDALHAVRLVGLAHDLRVAAGNVLFLDVKRQLPRHLVVRLVEARERAARIDRLEERVRVGLGPFGLGVDALALHVIDRCAIRHLDRDRPDRQLLVGDQADELLAARDHPRRMIPDLRARDRDAARVQPDHAGRLHHLRGDPDDAVDVVAGRDDR